jgi:multidrug efflux pump subunit AcrA (membrane-fusion protein)
VRKKTKQLAPKTSAPIVPVLPDLPPPVKSKRRWLRRAVVVAVLAAVAGGYFWWRHQVELGKIYTPDFKLVERGELLETLDVSGAIAAKKHANLHFLLGGEVTAVPGLEGVSLAKGALIAQLDRSTLQKQLEKTLNNYSMQRLSWDQQLDDIKDRTIDQQERRLVDRNQLILNNSVLDVEITSLSFDDYQMFAPFDGVIVAAPIISAKVVIGPSDVFEIVDPESLVLKALVDETDIKLVAEGQTATITFDAYNQEEASLDSYVGQIGYKNVSHDANAVYVLELPLPSNDLKRFRLGMNATAHIILSRRLDAIKVALEDVDVDNDGNYFVYLKDPSTPPLLKQVAEGEREIISGITKQIVTIGLETQDYYEIIDGLQPGQEIVVFN